MLRAETSHGYNCTRFSLKLCAQGGQYQTVLPELPWTLLMPMRCVAVLCWLLVASWKELLPHKLNGILMFKQTNHVFAGAHRQHVRNQGLLNVMSGTIELTLNGC